MENFKEFVDSIVDKWRKEKFKIYENKGLSMPANRIMGDWAEKNIVERILKIKPHYDVVLSKGSQTPSDVFSISKRKGFYHLMLNQVKSTTSPGKYFYLQDEDLKRYREFGKWFRKEANKLNLLKGKPLIVTLGYVIVYNKEVKGKIVSDVLLSTIYKNVYFLNFNEIDKNSAFDLVLKSQYQLLKK